MSPTPHDLAGGRPDGGAADAFWWMYEHVPGAFDPLIRFGRRHVLPLIRGGAEITAARRNGGSGRPAGGGDRRGRVADARLSPGPNFHGAAGRPGDRVGPAVALAPASGCHRRRLRSRAGKRPARLGRPVRLELSTRARPDRGQPAGRPRPRVHARGGQPDGSSGSGARAQLRLRLDLLAVTCRLRSLLRHALPAVRAGAFPRLGPAARQARAAAGIPP